MGLALWSLQGREDVVRMSIDDWLDGVPSVRRHGVVSYGTGLLRITSGDNLRATLIACLTSPEGDDCPFLVHRQPIRRTTAAWREHPFQLVGEVKSRGLSPRHDEFRFYDCEPARCMT